MAENDCFLISATSLGALCDWLLLLRRPYLGRFFFPLSQSRVCVWSNAAIHHDLRLTHEAPKTFICPLFFLGCSLPHQLSSRRLHAVFASVCFCPFFLCFTDERQFGFLVFLFLRGCSPHPCSFSFLERPLRPQCVQFQSGVAFLSRQGEPD